MKLNKDEARILSEALNDAKFKITECHNIENLFENLESLEMKLSSFGEDNRRKGRTSQNDWIDLLKRFANK